MGSVDNIGSSPHKQEYVRMLEAGWSPWTVAKYAQYRRGEQLEAGQVRKFRYDRGIEVASQPFPGVPDDPLVDVVGERARLIALQKARIGLDAGHERDTGRLLQTTGREIDLLSRLLDAHKRDLQQLGEFPGEPLPEARVASAREWRGSPSLQGGSLSGVSLGELLGVDAGGEREAARTIHGELE